MCLSVSCNCLESCRYGSCYICICIYQPIYTRQQFVLMASKSVSQPYALFTCLINVCGSKPVTFFCKRYSEERWVRNNIRTHLLPLYIYKKKISKYPENDPFNALYRIHMRWQFETQSLFIFRSESSFVQHIFKERNQLSTLGCLFVPMCDFCFILCLCLLLSAQCLTVGLTYIGLYPPLYFIQHLDFQILTFTSQDSGTF